MTESAVNEISENRFNEASVQLPAALVDKSIQMYMPADGSKAFNIVVSRSEVEPDETVEAFAERLLDHSRRTLTRFNLEDRRERIVAQVPGVELTFTWRANGAVLHQRQAIFLAPGAAPGKPTGLIITGTCQGMLMHPYPELFEQTVASLQWRYPPASGKEAANAPAVPEAMQDNPFEGLAYVYALSRRNRILYAFDTARTACGAIPPDDLQDGGVWLFFDAAGRPLQVQEQAGQFMLIPCMGEEPPPVLGTYLSGLVGTDYIRGTGADDPRPALREHLTLYRAHFAANRQDDQAGTPPHG